MSRSSGGSDADQQAAREPGREELLEALEKIRVLLEKEAAQHDANRSSAEPKPAGENTGTETDAAEEHPQANQEREQPAEPVPLLDDVVGGGLGLDESPLTERTQAIDSTGGLDDDLFAALLGDAWKTSAADMLRETRADIEAHRERWTPEQTDSLNEALRVRIDETLKTWLHALVRSNLEDLRNTLLAAIDDQLKQELRGFLADRAGASDRTEDDSYGQ